jgi:hypothetical protein
LQDINYSYDPVGNITQINNSSQVYQNSMGGNYSSTYTYDNLYRLTGASGTTSSSSSGLYNLSMEYSPSGRILTKQQNYGYDNVHNAYTYSYAYQNHAKPHAVTGITDLSISPAGNPQTFAWDGNGNMICHNAPHTFGERKLCWNEENRLTGVADDYKTSVYVYQVTLNVWISSYVCFF